MDVQTDSSTYRQSESRISELTILLGAAAALVAGFFHGWRWGAGLMIGTLLAWLNFRWLKQGVDALTETVITQSSRKKG